MMLVALAIVRPRYSFGSPSSDWLVDAVGLVLIFAGQTLRVITIGYDYIRRGGRDGRVYAEGLVQGGVFAHCRNPLYLGNILMAIGFLVLIGHRGLMALGIPLVILVYTAIVAAEEDFLSREFGDRYADYRARVNRWYPQWRGFRQSVAPMRFNWRRVLAKEYNTLFGVLLLLLLIQTVTCLQEDAMTEARWMLCLAAGALLLASYITVRLFKKTGRLRP